MSRVLHVIILVFICEYMIEPYSARSQVVLDRKEHAVSPMGRNCMPCHSVHSSFFSISTEDVGSGTELWHVPYREQKCNACHSPERDAFVFPFSTSEYVGYTTRSYALCWQCHEIEHVLGEGRPANTGFINGGENLHRIHVVQPRGVNCINCHDPHASILRYLIDPCRMDPGVGRRIPCEWPTHVEFTSDGGTCAPWCHRQQSYSRKAISDE